MQRPPDTSFSAICRLRPGLTAFFQSLLQKLLAQHLVGEHPLEPGVLLLKLLELLGLIDLHHAELLLPPVEGLLADLPLTADVPDRLVAFLRLTQNPYLLFCSVSFALHCMGPF